MSGGMIDSVRTMLKKARGSLKSYEAEEDAANRDTSELANAENGLDMALGMLDDLEAAWQADQDPEAVRRIGEVISKHHGSGGAEVLEGFVLALFNPQTWGYLANPRGITRLDTQNQADLLELFRRFGERDESDPEFMAVARPLAEQRIAAMREDELARARETKRWLDGMPPEVTFRDEIESLRSRVETRIEILEEQRDDDMD